MVLLVIHLYCYLSFTVILVVLILYNSVRNSSHICMSKVPRPKIKVFHIFLQLKWRISCGNYRHELLYFRR